MHGITRSVCPVFWSFHTVQEVLTQAYWSDLPFPPSVDHVLSEPSTITHPSLTALHGMAHRFTELFKPFRHDKTVIHEGVTGAEDIKKTEQEYTEELNKKRS